jgi:hypothetical protein
LHWFDEVFPSSLLYLPVGHPVHAWELARPVWSVYNPTG